MDIQVKSSNGIHVMPIETRLLAGRKVFINGEIDSSMAVEFVKQIMFLNQEDRSPIDVLINSPGGQINAGMLMYDVIQSSKAPIRVYCLGKAYSMAAVLLACATPGNRYIFPNSEVMIHEPSIESYIGGSASSLKSISTNLAESKRKMDCILAKHTGKSRKEIEQATSFDHYMSSDEAIAFGLCDKKILDLSIVMEV